MTIRSDLSRVIGACRMNWRNFFRQEAAHRQAIGQGFVVPESERCVQCGICSFSCPLGIDVRRHAWQGTPIKDSYCLTCGTCVDRCPRGVMRLERTNLFDPEKFIFRGE